jgi:hypothetical protein
MPQSIAPRALLLERLDRQVQVKLFPVAKALL